MKDLVTGGAGFIGCHLVERLLGEGREVVVVDDFSTGHRDNLEPVNGHPGLTIAERDIAEAMGLDGVFNGVDRVFHLAGRADIVPSIENPELYYRANVTGTLNVLQAARAAGVRRLVYAASSSCYGIPDQYPTPETTAIRPQYPYALTKYLGEELVMHWAQVYGLPSLSLRLFNVYGPRVRTTGAYGAVFGVFLAQLANGRALTVVGDGKQTRDFTYVTDVVDAFVTAANSDLTGEIMNVGSDGHYSVNELVDLLGGEAVHIPKRPGEPDCTWADVTKIERLLGWHARVPFAEGVRRMMAQLELWKGAPLWDPESIAGATSAWFRYLGKDSQA